jgi:hypothetical protein
MAQYTRAQPSILGCPHQLFAGEMKQRRATVSALVLKLVFAACASVGGKFTIGRDLFGMSSLG